MNGSCSLTLKKMLSFWSPPPGVPQFDTNGASKEKLGPEGKCYLKEKVKFLFSGQIGTTNSDEANVWVI